MYNIMTLEGLYPNCEVILPCKYKDLYEMLLDEPTFIMVVYDGTEYYIRADNIDSIHKTPVLLTVLEGGE